MSQPFFDAIRAGDLKLLRSLLEKSPQLVHAVLPEGHGPDEPPGGTGLHLSVCVNNVAVAELLISCWMDLDTRNNDGRTALHDAIEDGRREIVTLLIERGAELDICAAGILGKIERVREWLLRDPELVNDRSTNLSPLGWASFGNQPEVAAELIARGARMDDGELLCAASVGHVEVGRVLLDNGADPNAADERSGGNALHSAVCMRYTCDSTAFVSMLLDAGADPATQTRSGKTALQLAEDGARKQSSESNDGRAEELVRNYDGVAQILLSAGDSSTLDTSH